MSGWADYYELDQRSCFVQSRFYVVVIRFNRLLK